MTVEPMETTQAADGGSPTTTGLRRWLETVWPPRPPLTAQAELPDPILAPCRGDVFDFQVFPYLTWRAENLDQDQMRLWMQRFTRPARVRLRRLAVEVACEYAPHESDAFGDELNERLADTCWRFTREQVELNCQAWCRVTLDQTIRTALQPLWQKRIEMEEQHRIDLRNAALARELTEVWSGIIEKLHDDPYSEPATALTDPKVAEIFAQWRKKLSEETESLLEILRQAGRDHRRMGMYERARTYEDALKAFRKEHGLPGEDPG